MYRPILSQLSYKKQSFKCLTLEIFKFLLTSLPSPLFFPDPLHSTRFYKSKIQIFRLCNELHMQKVRNCPFRYLIEKKYLKKFIGEKNNMLPAFCLQLEFCALFIFTVCPFHHLWHKEIGFLLRRKPQPLGGSSFWSNCLKFSNENREMVLIFIILKVIPRSCLTQIQCSYKFNKFCKGNSSNSCEKNEINRSQNKCHLEICQLLMDS